MGESYLNASDEGEGGAYGMGEMLEGVQGDILKMMRDTKAIPETFLENLEAFQTAVNWRETWLQMVLAGHLVMWLTFLVFRKWPRIQALLFLSITVLVAAAEPLNSFCAKNWQKFATQNYFDEQGVFATVFLCAPLLALAIAMLASFLIQASSLLIEVKSKELQAHIKKQKKEKEATDASLSPRQTHPAVKKVQ